MPLRPSARASGLTRLANLFLAALRRLLYVVVRTHVTPEPGRAAHRPAAPALLRAPGPAAVEPARARGGSGAAGLALGAGADRPRVPGRRARRVLGDPQSQSAQHAHRRAVGRAGADDGGAAARSGARHPARAGDGAVGPLAGLAGLAPQGALRRRLGERRVRCASSRSSCCTAGRRASTSASRSRCAGSSTARPTKRPRCARRIASCASTSAGCAKRRSDPTCRTGAT